MPETDPEGARSFTRFLDQVADGDLHTEASQLLHRLVEKMQQQTRAQAKEVKGELTLKLKLSMDGALTTVAYEINGKEPAPRRPGSVFFVTRGGNLSVQNERQQELPLREVKRDGDAQEVPPRKKDEVN